MVIVSSACAVAFASIALIVWVVFISIRQESETTTSGDTSSLNNDVYDQVQSIVSKEGMEAAQIFLDEKISQTNNETEQAQLYLEKSSLSSNDENKNQALEYAYNAESLDPNEKTAFWVAIAEESVGNIEEAIKYYRLFLERAPDRESDIESSDGIDYDFYENHVKELEASLGLI